MKVDGANNEWDNIMSIYNKQNLGFSLVEMSFIIVGFALVLTAVVSTEKVTQERQSYTHTDDTLERVEEAISYYFAGNGSLPCPASLEDAPNSANYGKSTDCSDTTAPAGTSHRDNGTGASDEYQLRVGMIPTRTLGLPDSYALDSWGNRLSYAMIRQLGIDKTTYDSYEPSQTTDLFQIRDEAGTILYGRDEKEIVGYVIISHGKDRKGAHTKQVDTEGIDCGDQTIDKANCDTDKIFVAAAINDRTSGADYYYDFVRWNKAFSGEEPAPPIVYDIIKKTTTLVTSDHSTHLITSGSRLFLTGNNDEGTLGIGSGSPAIVTSFTEEYQGYSDWETLVGGSGWAEVGFRPTSRMFHLGTSDDAAFPGANRALEFTTPETGWDYIDMVVSHVCAITSGKLYCMGDNTYGQLGLGDLVDRATFVQVGSDEDWAIVNLGQTSTCAIKTSGQLYCWGRDVFGRLGLGTASTSYTTPQRVGTGSDWTYISVGDNTTHNGLSCGLRKTGELWCSGQNSNGQMGQGGSADPVYYTHQRVGTESDWIHVRVAPRSGQSVCGIRNGGEAYCWGRNNNGQLGIDTSGADVTTPQRMAPTISDWIDVQTHSLSGCGIRSGGELYCWGENERGQFGNGSTSTSAILPTQTPGITVALPVDIP